MRAASSAHLTAPLGARCKGVKVVQRPGPLAQLGARLPVDLQDGAGLVQRHARLGAPAGRVGPMWVRRVSGLAAGGLRRGQWAVGEGGRLELAAGAGSARAHPERAAGGGRAHVGCKTGGGLRRGRWMMAGALSWRLGLAARAHTRGAQRVVGERVWQTVGGGCTEPPWQAHTCTCAL